MGKNRAPPFLFNASQALKTGIATQGRLRFLALGPKV